MLEELLGNHETAWYCTALAVMLAVAVTVFNHFNYAVDVSVPIIGRGTRFTKWLAAVENIWNARDSIENGYMKYKESAFQIPTLTRMNVFLCDRTMTREYFNLSEDLMSFPAVMSEEFQFKYTLPGLDHLVRRLPNSVIAKALSWQRARASNPADPWFTEFSDEFLHGFDEELRLLGAPAVDGKTSWSRLLSASSLSSTEKKGVHGWTSVPCFPFSLKLIARLTTKSLFSAPICRNDEFLDMCCKFADAVPRDAMVLHCFPGLFRGYITKFLGTSQTVGALRMAISKEIQSREASGKEQHKDLLDYTLGWVEDHKSEGWDSEHAVDMMCNTVFAALHTSSQLVTHTIFELATRPEYLEPLRSEILQCFNKYGVGTKEALDAMHKVDSFIKETQRCNPLDPAALARLVLKPYTFANGLHIPKGTLICTPNSPLFQDATIYPEPEKFDGFRFERMRDDPAMKSTCSLVSTSENSMHFGVGRHACPGRYMVSDEVRLVMVHFLLHYEFAIEGFGPRPPNFLFRKFLLPSMDAKIWVKKIE